MKLSEVRRSAIASRQALVAAASTATIGTVYEHRDSVRRDKDEANWVRSGGRVSVADADAGRRENRTIEFVSAAK